MNSVRRVRVVWGGEGYITWQRKYHNREYVFPIARFIRCIEDVQILATYPKRGKLDGIVCVSKGVPSRFPLFYFG